jgi:hypothetical protein
MKKSIVLITLSIVFLVSCKKDKAVNNDTKITTDPTTLPQGYISAIIDGIPTSFTIGNNALRPSAIYDTSIGTPYLYNELWMDGIADYPGDSSEFIRLDFSNPDSFANGYYPCIFTPGTASKSSSFSMVYYAKHYGPTAPEYASSICNNPSPAGGIVTSVSISDSSFQGIFSGTVANIDSTGSISYHYITEGAFNVKIVETRPNNDQ